jgi:hypothetical protein
MTVLLSGQSAQREAAAYQHRNVASPRIAHPPAKRPGALKFDIFFGSNIITTGK